MSVWQDIATAPRDGTRVRVAHAMDPNSLNTDSHFKTTGIYRDGEWICTAGFVCTDMMLRWEPTHWLPEPPGARPVTTPLPTASPDAADGPLPSESSRVPLRAGPGTRPAHIRSNSREDVIVKGHLRFYPELIQGSDEWHAARCGLLTASEMKLIVTPTLKVAANEKERTHLYELLAQRISGYVEPTYIGDDMLRGHEDEVEARILYAKNIAPVEECGIITNDRFGFTLGYSPDGLVGEDGQIECKSRRQKYQIQTIIENVAGQTVPDDYLIHVQAGLLVSEREWCDFISYSGGHPMVVIRAHPIPEVQEAIFEAASAFEKRLSQKLEKYREALESGARLFPTERKIHQEMFV